MFMNFASNNLKCFVRNVVSFRKQQIKRVPSQRNPTHAVRTPVYICSLILSVCILVYQVMAIFLIIAEKIFGLPYTTERCMLFLWLRSGSDLRQTNLCCVYGVSGLVYLIRIMLVSNRTTTMNADEIAVRDLYNVPLRPAAHFTPHFSSQGTIDWRNTISEYRHGYTNLPILPETGIRITKTGYYSVYGMFTLTSEEHADKPEVISHQIVKKSNDSKSLTRRNIVLLQKKTERSRNKFACQTSFLMGATFLESGDTLHTSISNASAVYRYSPTSYWGLYYAS